MTWYPTCLDSAYGKTLGPVKLALLAGLPLLGRGFGSLVAGFSAAPLARLVGGVGRARRLLAASGFVAASGLLLASLHAANPFVLALLIALAGMCNDVVLPCA